MVRNQYITTPTKNYNYSAQLTYSEPIDRAMEEATKFQLEQSAKDEEEGIKVMEDYGCKVNTLTDEQKMEFQKIMENADVFGVAKDSMENPKFFDGMLKDLEEYRMKGEK